MVEGYHREQDSHDGYGQVLIIAGKKKNQSGRNSSETKIIFCKKAGKKLSVQGAVLFASKNPAKCEGAVHFSLRYVTLK